MADKDLRQGAAPVGDCGTKEGAHARWGRLGSLRFVTHGLGPCIQGRRLRDYHAAPWMTGTGAQSGPPRRLRFFHSAGAGCLGLWSPWPISQNSSVQWVFERRESRMSLERRFCEFRGQNGVAAILSQKPSFLRHRSSLEPATFQPLLRAPKLLRG
jgi:hypothetical protein